MLNCRAWKRSVSFIGWTSCKFQ